MHRVIYHKPSAEHHHYSYDGAFDGAFCQTGQSGVPGGDNICHSRERQNGQSDQKRQFQCRIYNPVEAHDHVAEGTLSFSWSATWHEAGRISLRRSKSDHREYEHKNKQTSSPNVPKKHFCFYI